MRISNTLVFTIGTSLIIAVLWSTAVSQEKKSPVKPTPAKTEAKQKPKKRKPRGPEKPALAAIEFDGVKRSLAQPGRQLDLPACTQNKSGEIFIAYIDHNGKEDQLKLAKMTEDILSPLSTIGPPGIIHDPTLTVDLSGAVWCFWGQTNDKDIVELFACRYDPVTTSTGEVISVAKSGGAETFADAGLDSNGRVWVTWQSMRNHRSDIFARYYDPKTDKWSKELPVTQTNEGDWEPQIEFDDQGNTWIVYDSAVGNEFNISLARVSPDRSIKIWPIAHSPRYEARASIAGTADGKGFWIAAERGKVRWALDSRGHGNNTGINAKKTILFGRFDIESGTFKTIPVGQAGKAGNPINLPTIGVAPDGSPWVSYRYFERVLWRIAVTRYDVEKGMWSQARRIDGSTFGQDRSSHFLTGKDGKLWHCWTSDLRDTKASKEAGIYLAAINPDLKLPIAQQAKADPDLLSDTFSPSQSTPERPFKDRHTWKIDGTEHGLFWGDVHRHTDVSNCRTGYDGCINEHFRYAYDIGKLDFMGTSDHTDVGKIYSPYEWWHNQKMHDVFHTPGRFNSLYVYEREQRWPWGHRNVVFTDRGGPLVYIQRSRYLSSIWQKDLPAKPGIETEEIDPPELWDILERSGKNVAIVSHTGATGMGTDWGRYDKIDYRMETLVEIFQGARVSYEGAGAPQPTAGLRPDEKYTVNGDAKNAPPPPTPVEDFGKYKAGLYQNALTLGHRLGVFTSSDHISTHVSYGGVYCKEFTREGIVEGFKARRTIAATDKIYLNFTCNGKPLGSIFSTENKPDLWFKVDGTGKLKRVTIVRNEKNWKVFDSIEGVSLEKKITDDSPGAGENRYYIRVEQEDGNMAWSSPVWVEVK